MEAVVPEITPEHARALKKMAEKFGGEAFEIPNEVARARIAELREMAKDNDARSGWRGHRKGLKR